MNQYESPTTIVTGAVVEPGEYLISPPRTIEKGLAAAGGLARTPKRWAAGPIHVRRIHVNRNVSRWEFNLMDPEEDWRKFELLPGDSLVFTWHIEEV